MLILECEVFNRSNKSINDTKDNSAQGLSQDDIARLKAEGKGGEELVAQLCANSARPHLFTHHVFLRST